MDVLERLDLFLNNKLLIEGLNKNEIKKVFKIALEKALKSGSKSISKSDLEDMLEDINEFKVEVLSLKEEMEHAIDDMFEDIKNIPNIFLNYYAFEGNSNKIDYLTIFNPKLGIEKASKKTNISIWDKKWHYKGYLLGMDNYDFFIRAYKIDTTKERLSNKLKK